MESLFNPRLSRIRHKLLTAMELVEQAGEIQHPVMRNAAIKAVKSQIERLLDEARSDLEKV